MGDERDPCCGERVSDVNLEGVQLGLRLCMVTEVVPPGLGVLQVAAQHLRTFGVELVGVHVGEEKD